MIEKLLRYSLANLAADLFRKTSLAKSFLPVFSAANIKFLRLYMPIWDGISLREYEGTWF